MDLDVAIVGGGLAGNLLARQLHLQAPDLAVAVFEKSTERSYKVGEATVEIASHYLIRRQQLSTYLYEEHLPKNGLRYFYDSESRDLPIEQMSEVGTNGLPFHPTFQVDRARLETDLIEMNRKAGIRVREGARVTGIELGSDGAEHGFEVHEEGRTYPVRCRWLVDAAGRVGLVARQKGLRVREEQHRLGSVWGRFENVVDIDGLGDDEWRGRVRHTSRRLSTLHFWYPGYWIWFIPLRGGVTSIGLTGECVTKDRALRTPEGFRAFLEEHRAVASLLEGAKQLDVGSLTQIAYGTKRYMHPDRWGLSGESATAADPLYSPGSDFIALENDFLCDLIRRDAAGEDLRERCELYDGFLHFRQEAALLLYRGLYSALGSCELARAKWDFDIGCYYNLWVHSYMRGEHLDTSWLRRQLRQKRAVLRAMHNFADLFQKVEAKLRERGEYFRDNQGHFYHGLRNIHFAPQVGEPRTRREVFASIGEVFDCARKQALELLSDDPELKVEPMPLTSYMVDRPLA